MNPTFSPGEIAILTCDGRAGPTGAEVEVLGKLTRGDYMVRGVRGNAVVCEPRHLRKRQPPDPPAASRADLNRKVDWKDCAFTPEKVDA